MAIETFPIKICFKRILIDDIVPEISLQVNDTVILENHFLETDELNFTIDIDDDIEGESTIKIDFLTDTQDPKFWDEETGDWKDMGFHITDIELNEISVETLIFKLGIVDVPLCLEKDYAEDGFIQWLEKEEQTDGLQVIDGRYHYIANGDWVHMLNSSYSFTFKTPLYFWLLELLLQ